MHPWFGPSFAFKACYTICQSPATLLLLVGVPQGWALPRSSPGGIHSFTRYLWQWITEVQTFPACLANQACSVHLGRTLKLSNSVYLWVLSYHMSWQDPHYAGFCGTSWQHNRANLQDSTKSHFEPYFSLCDFSSLDVFPCIWPLLFLPLYFLKWH